MIRPAQPYAPGQPEQTDRSIHQNKEHIGMTRQVERAAATKIEAAQVSVCVSQ
jgi:hypothetical protein